MYSGLKFETYDNVVTREDTIFEPRHSGAEHVTSRSQMLHTMLNYYERVGRNSCYLVVLINMTVLYLYILYKFPYIVFILELINTKYVLCNLKINMAN